MLLTRMQFSGPNRTYQIALRALCHWKSVGLPSYQQWGLTTIFTWTLVVSHFSK